MTRIPLIPRSRDPVDWRNTVALHEWAGKVRRRADAVRAWALALAAHLDGGLVGPAPRLEDFE